MGCLYIRPIYVYSSLARYKLYLYHLYHLLHLSHLLQTLLAQHGNGQA